MPCPANDLATLKPLAPPFIPVSNLRVAHPTKHVIPSGDARAFASIAGRWRASQSRDLHFSFPPYAAAQFEIHSPGLNFEVTYPSGTILTEAPSIVETTHTPNVAHLFRGEAFHAGRLIDPAFSSTYTSE